MIELTTSLMMLMSAVYTGSPAALDTAVPVTTEAEIIVKEQVLTEKRATMADIETYVREYYKDTPILAEVARCESTFTQFSKNGKVMRGIENTADVGLMQINEYYHAETAKKFGYNIYSVEGNLAYGKYLYDKKGTAPWSASSPCWGKKVGAQVAVR
jgi:Transglycosylase SLT domain